MSRADGKATDLQRDTLLAAWVDAEHIYSDTASRKRDDRPGLLACLEALRGGDTMVVWKIDRLGCGLRHLVDPIRELSERGIGFP